MEILQAGLFVESFRRRIYSSPFSIYVGKRLASDGKTKKNPLSGEVPTQ